MMIASVAGMGINNSSNEPTGRSKYVPPHMRNRQPRPSNDGGAPAGGAPAAGGAGGANTGWSAWNSERPARTDR